MSRPTYSIRALVLRRTKLGETDVICTLLASTGSQVRAVAKGARKPTSSFSSRLEVYSVCDLLLVKGKNLDIIKEARLIEPNDYLRGDFDLLALAAPMVELMDCTSQIGLEDPRLFQMTCKALALLRECAADSQALLCAAHLIKASAILGFRPQLSECALCGTPVYGSSEKGHLPSYLQVSYLEGGVLCETCAKQVQSIKIAPQVVSCVSTLLYSSFEEIIPLQADEALSLQIIRFVQQWIRTHIGANLTSLSFLISQKPSQAFS